MRVHELDDTYEVSKEEVKAALEMAGLKTHNMSTLNESELSEFEAALEIVTSETEDSEDEGSEVVAEATEEPPTQIGPDLEPGETVVVDTRLEHTPDSEIFPVVNLSGEFVDNVLLPPGLSERVREKLGSNRICSHILDLDRGEFRFVVLEESKKYRIQIDV